MWTDVTYRKKTIPVHVCIPDHPGDRELPILFSENPTLQLMFPEFREYSTLEELKESRSLQGHTKRVMKVVENAVNSLEDGHALMEYLQELGRRHKTRQIKPTVSNLQEISQAINETFEENLGIKWTVEIAESWKLLLDYVMAMIIRGLRSP
ncbi:neuroglobin isoform X2 [Nematostella vectensis]|uniref:neuroglobin isoform X2 n=1 Tax=Nematostella vectensis TaxID=45351 RepID=UPI0020770CFC|nr:neuroglobin isoform X2 [Nematostella vectensis]